MPKRAEQVLLSLGNRLDSVERGPAAWVIGGALLAASLASFALRREPRDAFVLANAALLFVYFDFARRLTLPIFVLSIASAA
ncbi:MAG TPA: hypothetical protein VMS76_10930, partial [Planctomycetota bacterium]|nr:hypothetical protein [Planctomycetota bacterium]